MPGKQLHDAWCYVLAVSSCHCLAVMLDQVIICMQHRGSWFHAGLWFHMTRASTAAYQLQRAISDGHDMHA